MVTATISAVVRRRTRSSFGTTLWTAFSTAAAHAQNCDLYVDDWFASIVKSKSFYEKHASGSDGKRCYFYNIDLQGRLFLEETMPKNIATSIKDARFLDFFFRNIKRVDDTMTAWMVANDIPARDYPFVSTCGRQELNFVRPAAVPIVFHTLVESANGKDKKLLFGGRMSEPFDAKHGIAVSRVNGRLYHRLTALTLDRRNQNVSDSDASEYGLIRSSVAVALSDAIIAMDEENDERKLADTSESSGFGFQDGPRVLLPIPLLPLEMEPDSWAMPGTDG